MAVNGERPGTPEIFDVRKRTEQVREELESMKFFVDKVGGKPDYSLIFDSAHFKELPQEAKAEIRNEYSDTEVTVKKDDPEVKPDIAPTSPEYEEIRSIMSVMDSSVVFKLPEFLALSEMEQNALREEFGGGVSEEPERTVEHPEPTAESREARESEPKKRKFLAYHMDFDDENGEIRVTEDYQDWDRRRKEYRTREKVETTITIPEPLVSTLPTDIALQDTFASYCGDTRKELDERGVKLFYDPPKTEGGDMVPKWKFFFEGKTEESFLTLEDLPQEISTLVREDREYFRRPTYTKWFGKAMQRKREEIISRLAQEHFSELDESLTTTEEEPVVETSVVPEQETPISSAPSGETSPEGKLELVPSDVITRAEDVMHLLRDQFAILAKNEDDEKEIERHVQEAAIKLLAERYRKEGFDLDVDDIRDILSGKEIEKKDGEYDAAHAVFAEHLASSFDVSKNDNDRARAALELIRNARSGDPAVEVPSQHVLDDIAAGKHDDDGKRALTKAKFIDAHASLPLERAESAGKGVELMLDARYPLSQAVEDAVKDGVFALAGADRSDHHDVIVSKLGAKLARLVEAKPNNKLLAYDKKNRRLKVKDLEKFAKDMQAMYRKLTEDAG